MISWLSKSMFMVVIPLECIKICRIFENHLASKKSRNKNTPGVVLKQKGRLTTELVRRTRN